MESQPSSSGYSKELVSVLEKKRENFIKNIHTEEFAMSLMMTSNEQVRRWAISVGAMNLYETCTRCGAPMEITQIGFSNEEWSCSSKSSECEFYRTDEKFCFDMDLPMSILINVLYEWFRNQPATKIVSENNIDWEDYSYFDETLNDVCLMKCVVNSRKIGGLRVRVNVEVGRKGGTDYDSNRVVICGVCDDDESQYFFVILNSDNPHYLDVKALLNNWLLPGSIVFTSSEHYEFIKEMKWNKKTDWSLIVQTGCLARDFWIHIHQQTPKIFEQFILDVLEYSSELEAKS